MDELEAREWCRHYSETYIRVRIPPKINDWVSAQVVSAANDGGRIKAMVSIGRQTHQGWINDGEFEVDTTPPSPGYFAYGKHCLFYEKAPTRQWKRGLYGGNSSISNPYYRLMGTTFKHLSEEYQLYIDSTITLQQPPRLNGSIAKAIFERKHVSLEAAQDTLLSGQASMVSIGDDVALSVAPDRPGLLLWKYVHPVAEVDKKSIQTFDKVFRQEVIDFFHRQGRYDVVVR